jgi:hypothetical protein
MSARFKPWGYAAIGGILVSGTYNFLSKSTFPPHYHAWFGIKVLLALHVFGIVAMYNPERHKMKPRLLTGVAISGALILACSAYLRWLDFGASTEADAARTYAQFVRGGLTRARRTGCKILFVTCDPETDLQTFVDLIIAPAVGPEVIAGSTRLKAGTATKIVLKPLMPRGAAIPC